MSKTSQTIAGRFQLEAPVGRAAEGDICPGDRMRYASEASDCQVNWGNNDDPREHLTLGETYTVSDVDVRSWHTKLSFVECPGKRFNSVNFEAEVLA